MYTSIKCICTFNIEFKTYLPSSSGPLPNQLAGSDRHDSWQQLSPAQLLAKPRGRSWPTQRPAGLGSWRSAAQLDSWPPAYCAHQPAAASAAVAGASACTSTWSGGTDWNSCGRTDWWTAWWTGRYSSCCRGCGSCRQWDQQHSGHAA